MSVFEKIKGTLSSYLIVGISGYRIKENSGVIEFRDSGDSGFVKVRVADPSTDDNLANKRYADSLSTGVPVGSMQWYAGSSAPSGWLLLNADTIGNAVSGATHAGAQYETLFDIIKNVTPNTGAEVFGDGDTVTLPDSRQKFVLGKAGSGTGSTLGGSAGNIDHTHTITSHSHTLNSHTHGIGSHVHDSGTHTHDTSIAFSGTTLCQLTSFGTGTVRARPYQVAMSSSSGSYATERSGSGGNVATGSGTSGSSSPATTSTAPGTNTRNPAFIAFTQIVKY